jgi:hypothetical protein
MKGRRDKKYWRQKVPETGKQERELENGWDRNEGEMKIKMESEEHNKKRFETKGIKYKILKRRD